MSVVFRGSARRSVRAIRTFMATGSRGIECAARLGAFRQRPNLATPAPRLPRRTVCRHRAVRSWVGGALLPFCLAPAAIAVGATESARSESPETTKAVSVDRANTPGAQAPAPPQETWRSIFSSIIEYFRPEPPAGPVEEGRNEDLPPAPNEDSERGPTVEQAPGRERDSGSQGASELEFERDPERPPPRADEAAHGSAARGDTDDGGQRPIAAPREDEVRGPITVDHVHQSTVGLLAEIGLLRDARGITGLPDEPEARQGATPLAVYIKSREVMEKTARLQRRLGMIPVEIAPIPVRHIGPQDIHHNVRAITEELRRVKRQLVIEQETPSAPLGEGTTPARVYQNLERASLELDELVGRPTSSNDVYMHVVQVRDEVALIASRLGVALADASPEVPQKKAPKEVAEQVLRAVYKTIHLQTRLGMEPSSVPSAQLRQVRPADVFDAANLLLAELMRIKVHMDLQTRVTKRERVRKKQSSDTFAEVLFILEALDAAIKAASDSRDP